MNEDEDFFVSWTEGGQRVRYSWARLSADSRRRVWGLLDARGREDARGKLGSMWTGRRWLRANDIPELVARDKSVIAATERKAEEERLRAERAKEEERLRADLKPRLLDEIRHERAVEQQALADTVDRLNRELRELRDRLKRGEAEKDRLRVERDDARARATEFGSSRRELSTELETLRKKIGTKDGINVQLAEKRAELARLQDQVMKRIADSVAADKALEEYRLKVAFKREDRYLWDAAPVELLEHLAFLEPEARADGAIAVLIHRRVSLPEIVRSLHVSKDRVQAMLQEDGNPDSTLNKVREWMGPTPDGYYTDEKLTGAELTAKVWELRDGGKTQRQIAKLTGVRLATVNEILKAPKPVAAANAPTSEHGTAAPSES